MTAPTGQLAFDLEIELPAWVPVYHPAIPATSFESSVASAAEWKEHQRQVRCRDCGGTMASRPATRSCGGGNRDGSFSLCDDCAALDGLREHTHHAHRCDPRPSSLGVHWTIAIECADCTWESWTERFVDGSMETEPVPDAVIEQQIAEHNTPFWGGRWGTPRMSRSEADRLIAEQARRRAAYVREVAA